MRRLENPGKSSRVAPPKLLGAEILLLVALAAMGQTGCTRTHYRLAANRQTYDIISQKANDPRWRLPRTDITPDPHSRFFDPYNPDLPPLPPGDPAAFRYMQCVDGMRGWKHWLEFGHTQGVENPDWTAGLGESDGAAAGQKRPRIDKLTLNDAIELGLINSRDYQEQLEDVYLAALALTYQRYRFQVRPIGFLGVPGTELFYEHDPDHDSALRLGPTNLGVSKLLPTGAQLVAELTNNTIWMFSGPSGTGTATSFAYSIVQPLMLGGGRRVVLENLTQSERAVLYAVRKFARFRKDFYVTVVTGRRAIPLPGSFGGAELEFLIRGARSPTVGFYFLLFQLQRWRNEESNVRRLERRVRALEALAEGGRSTALDSTQLQSSLEAARSRELVWRRFYKSQLDGFKIQLGLPPDIDVKLDDALLDQFRFVDPDLADLENRIRDFTVGIAALRRQPSPEHGRVAIKQLRAFHAEVGARLHPLADELRQLDEILPRRSPRLQADEAQDLRRTIADDHARYDEMRRRFEEFSSRVASLPDKVGVEAEGQAASLATQLTDLREALLMFVREIRSLQVAIRVELIVLPVVDLSFEQAVDLAIKSRLDLMNRRAFVMDARRRVEVAANRLEAVLNVVAEGSINTPSVDANRGLFDFRRSASEYRAGVQFQTPLDRRRARNDFRAAQISYQRARRNYMAAEDQVKLDVRTELRTVKAKAATLEVNRRALRVAARELDQAIEFSQRPGAGGQPASAQGLNIARALANVLRAQNTLIDTWVDYETARLALYRDMGTMQIDATGLWSNDPAHVTAPAKPIPASAPERLPPPDGQRLPPPEPRPAPASTPRLTIHDRRPAPNKG